MHTTITLQALARFVFVYSRIFCFLRGLGVVLLPFLAQLPAVAPAPAGEPITMDKQRQAADEAEQLVELADLID